MRQRTTTFFMKLAFSSLALLSPIMCSRLRAADPVVFVSRHFDGVPEPATRKDPIELATSGRLLVLETDGSVRVLVDAGQGGVDTPADVSDPDISFDAESIVFAGYSTGEGGWRIFEINADGSGLRQRKRGRLFCQQSEGGGSLTHLEKG